MAEEHPNIRLLKQLDLRNIPGCAHLFSENFVWHFFNPQLPDLEGDYTGLAGLGEFFQKLGSQTKRTFKSVPQAVAAYGDELVVAHARNSLIGEEDTIELDAVVVWRMVDGKITEAWDIPAVHTASQLPAD